MRAVKIANMASKANMLTSASAANTNLARIADTSPSARKASSNAGKCHRSIDSSGRIRSPITQYATAVHASSTTCTARCSLCQDSIQPNPIVGATNK